MEWNDGRKIGVKSQRNETGRRRDTRSKRRRGLVGSVEAAAREEEEEKGEEEEEEEAESSSAAIGGGVGIGEAGVSLERALKELQTTEMKLTATEATLELEKKTHLGVVGEINTLTSRLFGPSRGDKDEIRGELKEHRASATRLETQISDTERKVANAETAVSAAKTALQAAREMV